MHEVVEPRPVAHRRSIEREVVRLHLVDIDEIAQCHRGKIAGGDHHPLGRAGGARGVEQPGHVAGRHRPRFAAARRGTEAREFRRLGRQDPHRPGQHRAKGGRARRVGKYRAGARIAQDPGRLARVQLGVDRHRGGAGPPDAIERFEIGGAVGQEQRDPVARRPALRGEPGADARGGPGEIGVAAETGGAAEQRRPLGVAPGGAPEPLRRVHFTGSRIEQ